MKYSKEYKRLSIKLKETRIKSGLKQTTLAHKIGKSQSYISKIEKNKLRIDIFELKELSKLFKKDTHYFIG